MSREFERIPKSGWALLFLCFGGTIVAISGLVWSIYRATQWHYDGPVLPVVVKIVAAALALMVMGVLWAGFFWLQPNQAAVLLLLGRYKGSVRQSGFFWASPFYTKVKVSLRARTLNGEKLKVNDQRGNPIEIAAVVVWRVQDTAAAAFDVEDYTSFVAMQSETAVRHLASAYAYDNTEDQQHSLRGSMEEVSGALRTELQARLMKSGVVVEEARLSHLAYAPEIAGVMLRRQQAEAIISARTRIVEGAVGMVRMALAHLEKDAIVDLDPERKAAMVSNLLVVLCSEQAAQPVLNTGTLHA